MSAEYGAYVYFWEEGEDVDGEDEMDGEVLKRGQGNFVDGHWEVGLYGWDCIVGMVCSGHEGLHLPTGRLK